MLEVSPLQPHDQTPSRGRVGVFLGILCVHPGLCTHLSMSIIITYVSIIFLVIIYHLSIISIISHLPTYLPAYLHTHLSAIHHSVILTSSFS